MGNQASSPSSKQRGSRKPQTAAEQAAERAKRVVGDLQEGIKNSVKKLDDDHPAAQLLDHVCGTYYHDDDKYRNSRSASYYSEDASEDGSRTFQSEDDTTYDGRRGRRSDRSVDSRSYMTQSDYDSDSRRRGRGASFDTEDESRVTHETEPKLISKPLASSFAKRCYFTKSGIGKTTQHYEGLTLTGNVVLMLASAMKLKGCPTICDEDLRRVEQTYPNQFSRLPDELLLSSGWRRISKYCHFSNKSIPDGIPFFHSKQRLHPSGGFYFLLAGSVGMIRPVDVEPLAKDTLVLLETDFPNQCDATPSILIRDPEQWVLVNKFCFFSGGPINTEEDVYYQADFDGNPIYMLAFLSPSLTPEELYKLTENGPDNEPGLKSVVDVQEVESVYDLTERDFDDLKLYHLGPCRALPQYILQPSAWTKVLPPHFLAARQQAMLRAQDYDDSYNEKQVMSEQNPVFEPEAHHSPEPKQYHDPNDVTSGAKHPFVDAPEGPAIDQQRRSMPTNGSSYLREAKEEGAFHSIQSGEINAVLTNQEESSNLEDIPSPIGDKQFQEEPSVANTARMDPPDDEPPSLKIGSMEENHHPSPHSHSDIEGHASLRDKPDAEDQRFLSSEPVVENEGDNSVGADALSEHYASPVSQSRRNHHLGLDWGRNDDSPNELLSPESNQYFQDEQMSPSNRHVQEPLRSPKKNHFEDTDELGESNEINYAPESYQRGIQEPMRNENEFQNDSHLHKTESLHVLPDTSEEKKTGIDPEVDSVMNNSGDVSEEELQKSFSDHNQPSDNVIEPIETSFTRQSECDDSPSSRPFSPSATSTNSRTESRSHLSPAMRGAHAILKRNRRRRAELNRSPMAKYNYSTDSMTSPATSEKPECTGSDVWEENGTDITGSAVSVSSGMTDKSSRRQLILQMAKARMKNNRESPSKIASPMNDDDNDGANTIITEGNATLATHDFDLTGDLD
mmetsp:Transcript_9044/g.26814  ORF Transcript_9044/g.26814 Transcript_9044/m.26814 type:complete len:960 (-) Transcript_9044:126-3005(-)|eukprot:CAMPEP_0172360230 /NCGR_PEP_ID=MMETSP1060-20121228/4305_1 /TAXON_ID=37318 /ORGANISM="Pseudo-nitzschia pungens, Strain cf. cingulata" /LENGTH=959 /DNA_ID=CAMNT_0013082177 /DNA_START=91 /DNA_END=2970 /DNA_ORIENTATION=-